MKKLLALLLSLALCVGTLATFVGCENVPSDTTSDSTSTEDTGSGDTPIEPETPEVFVAGVTEPSNVANYKANSGEKENEEAEFFVKNATYKVGDDNAFVFKPNVAFVNEELEAVTPAKWEYGYKLQVMGENDTFVDADSTYFDITPDIVNCKFDFAEKAVGNTFKLSVYPMGLTATQEANVAKYTVSLEFDVIDAYNVYTANELAYVSNYDLIYNVNDGTRPHLGWAKFREDNGLTYNPCDVKGIVLQANVVITKDSFPGSFLYTKEELEAGEPDLYVGSMKDDSANGVYYRCTAKNETFTFEGNYFNVDASKVPYVYKSQGGGKATVVDGEIVDSSVISHTNLFRFEGASNNEINGNYVINNVGFTGNSPKTNNRNVQGGVIMTKFVDTAATMNNVITKNFFISLFGGNLYTSLYFKNIKCYDAFNAPVYTWAATMYLDNCIIKNASGPAVITCTDSDGRSPRVICTNCEFDNPVTGGEAWFAMAGATALIPQIKQLDEAIRGVTGMVAMDPAAQAMGAKQRTFLKTEKVGDTETSFMNIICACQDAEDIAGVNHTPYVEYNGSVVGIPTQATDKSNGGTDETYVPTLTGTLINYCRAGAPVVESSAGGIFLINASFEPQEVKDMAKVAFGDYLNLYYYNELFGTLGIMLEYYNV